MMIIHKGILFSLYIKDTMTLFTIIDKRIINFLWFVKFLDIYEISRQSATKGYKSCDITDLLQIQLDTFSLQKGLLVYETILAPLKYVLDWGKLYTAQQLD